MSFHNKKIWYENELYNVEKFSLLVEREKERERERKRERKRERERDR